MATLIKRRARKPLAGGPAGIAWYPNGAGLVVDPDAPSRNHASAVSLSIGEYRFVITESELRQLLNQVEEMKREAAAAEAAA
jgi:hypothetical protein